MSHNSSYVSSSITATTLDTGTSDSSSLDDITAISTKYGEIFEEEYMSGYTDYVTTSGTVGHNSKSQIEATRCGQNSGKGCIVACSCNQAQGWYASRAAAATAGGTTEANTIAAVSARAYAQYEYTDTNGNVQFGVDPSANGPKKQTCYHAKAGCPDGYFQYDNPASQMDTNVYDYYKASDPNITDYDHPNPANAVNPTSAPAGCYLPRCKRNWIGMFTTGEIQAMAASSSNNYVAVPYAGNYAQEDINNVVQRIKTRDSYTTNYDYYDRAGFSHLGTQLTSTDTIASGDDNNYVRCHYRDIPTHLMFVRTKESRDVYRSFAHYDENYSGPYSQCYRLRTWITDRRGTPSPTDWYDIWFNVRTFDSYSPTSSMGDIIVYKNGTELSRKRLYTPLSEADLAGELQPDITATEPIYDTDGTTQIGEWAYSQNNGETLRRLCLKPSEFGAVNVDTVALGCASTDEGPYVVAGGTPRNPSNKARVGACGQADGDSYRLGLNDSYPTNKAKETINRIITQQIEETNSCPDGYFWYDNPASQMDTRNYCYQKQGEDKWTLFHCDTDGLDSGCYMPYCYSYNGYRNSYNEYGTDRFVDPADTYALGYESNGGFELHKTGLYTDNNGDISDTEITYWSAPGNDIDYTNDTHVTETEFQQCYHSRWPTHLVFEYNEKEKEINGTNYVCYSDIKAKLYRGTTDVTGVYDLRMVIGNHEEADSPKVASMQPNIAERLYIHGAELYAEPGSSITSQTLFFGQYRNGVYHYQYGDALYCTQCTPSVRGMYISDKEVCFEEGYLDQSGTPVFALNEDGYESPVIKGNTGSQEYDGDEYQYYKITDPSGYVLYASATHTNSGFYDITGSFNSTKLKVMTRKRVDPCARYGTDYSYYSDPSSQMDVRHFNYQKTSGSNIENPSEVNSAVAGCYKPLCKTQDGQGITYYSYYENTYNRFDYYITYDNNASFLVPIDGKYTRDNQAANAGLGCKTIPEEIPTRLELNCEIALPSAYQTLFHDCELEAINDTHLNNPTSNGHSATLYNEINGQIIGYLANSELDCRTGSLDHRPTLSSGPAYLTVDNNEGYAYGSVIFTDENGEPMPVSNEIRTCNDASVYIGSSSGPTLLWNTPYSSVNSITVWNAFTAPVGQLSDASIMWAEGADGYTIDIIADQTTNGYYNSDTQTLHIPYKSDTLKISGVQ